jgi:hypothetical protein
VGVAGFLNFENGALLWAVCCASNRQAKPTAAVKKFNGPYLLSKDVLREDVTPWLIKCPGEENLNNVGHFNTLPHM